MACVIRVSDLSCFCLPAGVPTVCRLWWYGKTYYKVSHIELVVPVLCLALALAWQKIRVYRKKILPLFELGMVILFVFRARLSIRRQAAGCLCRAATGSRKKKRMI